MKLNLSELSRELNCEFDISLDKQIQNIKIDSRKISEGDVFFAIKGESFDGHDFVQEAFNNGAIAAVIEKDIQIDDKICFKVENTIDSLQKVAKYYRSKFNIKVIGVTGSVGKSTVKEMVSSIFATEFKVTKSLGNLNGQTGLPLSIFNISDETQIAVLEMGVSKIGEMDILADIAKPDFAIVNNIGTSHIGNFGILENIIKEKLKISSYSDCKLYVNGDSLYDYLKEKDDIVYFGLNSKFSYRAENVSSLKKETEFILSTDSYKEIIHIPCLGVHNVYNALAAISLAADFGININDIKSGLLNYESLPMRQSIIKLKNFCVIDDSYNASFDSVKASIGLLKSLGSDGRNIAVLADILELGDYSREIHYNLGKFISASLIDILITVGSDSLYINEGAESTNSDLKSVHFETNDEAFNYICDVVKDNDKILIKGSHAMCVNEIVDKLVDKYGLNDEKD